MIKIPNFVVIDSIHGKFIVNRHCAFQAEALVKTGATHIEPELRNIKAIINLLPPNAVALDAGANIGFVAVPMANLLHPKGGKVIAFEPQRMLYNALCGTVALNDLSNLYVNNAAVGSKSGRLRVPEQDYGKPKDFGMVSLRDQSAIQSETEVDVVPIDNMNLERLDFLKVDVEGMEIDVLNGAAITIRKHRPWCWIEYWLVEKKALLGYFEGLDYTLYVMDQLNVLCAPNDKLKASPLTIEAPIFE